MGKKLYVGNLSYDVSNSDLEAMFAQHGTVESAQIIEDRATGRSKGFGFVEMSSDDEAPVRDRRTQRTGTQRSGTHRKRSQTARTAWRRRTRWLRWRWRWRRPWWPWRR